QGASSYDLIGGLFKQMASPEPARGGRFQNVSYFNGGLFAVVDPIELKRPEAYRLHEAARNNQWSKVRPEIFGAHFTSEFDIRKVVGPTIVRPWRERIDAAGKNVGELRRALTDLRKFRVLDPACGSGNFLFIAYREMKRLERDILLRLREVSRKEPLESAISLHQFYGIDIIPFAVELAKVTLMLAKELELIEAQKLAETDQLLIEEKPLPLDNLEEHRLRRRTLHRMAASRRHHRQPALSGITLSRGTVDFSRFTDREILEAFGAWLTEKRPEEWNRPRRIFPGSPKKGRKLIEYRVALERLGLMHLLHWHSPKDLRAELPEAWKQIARKQTDFRREIREASKFFRRLFPFLPDDERPQAEERNGRWLPPLLKIAGDGAVEMGLSRGRK
nr:N-6 DNA methylase [Verrucomicrobiota bacterium]